MDKFKTFGGECPSEITLHSGDVYVALKGATKDGSMVGSVARVPDSVIRGRLTQDTAKLDFTDPRPHVKRHIYWMLRTPQYRNYCAARATGSAAAGLSRKDFLDFTVPPISRHTRLLTESLDAMELRIEIHRHINHNLEAIAKAIFRAWFIDFEPVKAKIAGAKEFRGIPPDVFERLPRQFSNTTTLGDRPIPEGWQVGILGDYCKVNEKSIRKEDRTGQFDYLDISSVTEGKLESTRLVAADQAPSRARRRVRHGDTIWSCVRPNRKSYLFVHSPPANRIVSTGFAVLTPQDFGPTFLYYLVTSTPFVDYLTANASGSAYPAVRADHFLTAQVLIPPSAVREAFDKQVIPLRDLIASNEAESQILADLRDTLLSNLISDEIRVPTDEGWNNGR